MSVTDIGIRERCALRAREHAMAAAGLEYDEGRWIVAVSAGDWVQDTSFEEVPVAMLAASKWEPVVAKMWKYGQEAITIREARALLHAVERVVFLVRHARPPPVFGR